jgi:hypothetical protein
MHRKFLLTLAVATLAALASSKGYKVKLGEPSLLGSTELKPGEYQVEVVDDKAVFHSGKERSEAPVKVENAQSRYDTTTVRYTNGDGKYHIQEIHIGGTNTKLVFQDAGSAAGN